jgi:CAAX protease family protein
MIYIAAISLYAFYGVVALDFSRLIQLPETREVVIGHLLASLSEEIMFRGLVLSALSRAWGKTNMGLVMSLVLTSLLFSSLHIVQVWTGGVSLSMALLLIVQAFIISFWWGVIVLFRGSIWPTVVLHFTGNAIVALQGLSVPVITPGILAYERILFLSIPLGALAIGLLTQVRRPPAFHYVNG